MLLQREAKKPFSPGQTDGQTDGRTDGSLQHLRGTGQGGPRQQKSDLCGLSCWGDAVWAGPRQCRQQATLSSRGLLRVGGGTCPWFYRSAVVSACSHYVFTVFSAQTLRSTHEGSRVQTHRGHVSTATVKMQTVRPPERVYRQSRA